MKEKKIEIVSFNRRDFLKATIAGASAATFVNALPNNLYGFQNTTNKNKSKIFRDRLKKDGIIVMPGAFDALSAKLIEKLNSKHYFIQVMEQAPHCLLNQISVWFHLQKCVNVLKKLLMQ